MPLRYATAEPNGGFWGSTGQQGEGEWCPHSSETGAFHIRTQLILSHFLRNRAKTSFRLSPLP